MGFDWLFFAEVTLAGLGSGALLALTALAFVLIYKATQVVNLAIGEMLMMGAYLFFGFAATRLPAAGHTSAYAFGLGGAIETDLTVLPSLKMANFTARNVELRIERGGGFSSQTNTAGRIGSGLLQRYRVLLDPGARRMVLSRGRLADREPLKSTSGLLVAYEGKALRVLHVMRNSPAAVAGWAAGERICAIDGAPLPSDYLASPIAGWTAASPGRTVDLELCDKGGSRSLTLAQFY